jgi:chitin synthase
MKTISFEKYQIIFLLLLFNILFSTITTIYRKYWYIFIGILASSSLINSINVLLIFKRWILKYINISGNNFGNNSDNNTIYKHNNSYINKSKKYIYVVPCYKETQTELLRTINSLCEQKNVDKHQKILTIICDGKITNKDGIRTDQILVNDIFKNYIDKSTKYEEGYKTWTNKWENLEIHTGIYRNLQFIIFIKEKNIGKRDSLTLIRRFCYYYNKLQDNINTDELYLKNLRYFSPNLISFIETAFNDSKIYERKPMKIDYIIGTDADTAFDTNCSYELIKSIQLANIYVVGVVGMVDICKTWNPLVIFQYCEYLFAQCLKRHTQSIITNKVSCLSGCVQLITVCKETCGNKILNKFNYLPNNGENILNHVRSYASEDRNHLSLMFQLYPYVKTIQSMNAISYTNVPNTFMGFLRQRKRWCAGAASNDILLFQNTKHNKWERLQSFTNVLIFCLTIFIFVTTVDFLIAIITRPTYLMLFLSLIMFLPIIYSLLIPICVYNNGITTRNKIFNIFYYYLGFILYYSIGTILNIFCYFYTLYYLDDLNWNSKKITEKIDNLSIVKPKGIRFNIKLGNGILRFGCIYENNNDLNDNLNNDNLNNDNLNNDNLNNDTSGKGSIDITENRNDDFVSIDINKFNKNTKIGNYRNKENNENNREYESDDEFNKQNMNELWDTSEI